jgi:uncharacterized protein (DUF1330 family)
MKGHKFMATNSKLVFAGLVGVSIGIIGGMAIRGEQAKTPPGLIAEAEVTDPARLQNYGQKVEETLAPFNHHYVVRSSKIHALEGDAPKSRVVIIAFDSVEKAREWYDSRDHAAIRPIRQSSAKSSIFIVEGFSPQ